MENKEKETVKVSEETKETKTEKPKLFKKPKTKMYKSQARSVLIPTYIYDVYFMK